MNIYLDSNGRWRSGWRASIFLIALIFAVWPTGDIGRIINEAMAGHNSPGMIPLLIMFQALSLFPSLLVGWLCGKALEGLPFRALGAAFTRSWLKNWLFGMGLGGATLCFAVLLGLVFGGLRFYVDPEQGGDMVATSLGMSFLFFAVASAAEEALFRGYFLQTFVRSGLAWPAILLTSIFFGLAHIGNPNTGPVAVLNTILAGIWFGIAYLKTRDLWFVWGLHLMWNWMQGSLFGIEVSGVTHISKAPLLKEVDHGPSWLTGENYGLEGGIVCTIALLVSMAVIYFLPWLKPNEEILALSEPPAVGSAAELKET